VAKKFFQDYGMLKYHKNKHFSGVAAALPYFSVLWTTGVTVGLGQMLCSTTIFTVPYLSFRNFNPVSSVNVCSLLSQKYVHLTPGTALRA